MSDVTCASAPRLEGLRFRLPFGVGYVVLDRAPAFVDAARRLVRRPFTALSNRRVVAELSTMNAAQLADIGLTRADVIEAADVGAFGARMCGLERRAQERADRELARGERRP